MDFEDVRKPNQPTNLTVTMTRDGISSWPGEIVHSNRQMDKQQLCQLSDCSAELESETNLQSY
jgi:hypothetical protein